ncbi:MAG: hypothetical protein AAB481_04890 [Patescibacteria group bacterium]
MKKLLEWCKEHIMLVSTLVLLAIIPLYPKLPLLDIRHTWVYVRIEDFIVLFVLFFWGLLVVRREITLRTPLTLPILIFWIVGLVATLHGILLIFPSISDVYPNVAFLSLLRRMEYMSLFFVAYAAMKDKRYLPYIAVVVTVTLLAVSIYGIGQKYVGFPAFLTMNEEFAKGVPIRLSSLSRVSSTFSGHYDLAAYLVLVLPIIVSLIFGFRNWLWKGFLFATASLGFIVLFMTVSRISFFAFFISLGIVLLMQKKKLVLFSIPVIIVVTLFFLSVTGGLFDRFGNSIKEIDVVVNAKTGNTMGHSIEVPGTYFSDKMVMRQLSGNIVSLNALASSSAMYIVQSFTLAGETAVLLVEPNEPTGENLPQGTGYINLSLSPITRKLSHFFYEPKRRVATTSAEVFIIDGDYLLKKVLAYDLSFTTRFQGEWPRAMAAFTRNIFFGSGYGSVGMAVDNSYLRMLAEVGLLGFGFFFAIFIIIGVYIRKVLPDVDSPVARSFIIGFVAGIAGLLLNAFFIDVFEASKVAFFTWLLTGIVLGTIRLYQHNSLDIYNECKRLILSPLAIIVLLFLATFLLLSPILGNYFVGDDFTWFRWAATGNFSDWYKPFIDSAGFFYRPGARIYFLFMYSVFWLNQMVYHFVSILLHGIVVALVFLLAKKIFRNLFLSALTAFLFLILSGYSEAVYWISATGFLFTAVFSLASLLFYISWEEKKKPMYFIASFVFFILSLLFHELGIVTPFFMLLYKTIFFKKARFPKLLLFPLPVYLLVRYVASSHWLSGDYNYNLLKLPFNAVGNALGYFSLTLFGPIATPVYQAARSSMKVHGGVALLFIVLLGFIITYIYKKYHQHIGKEDRRIYVFGFLFFVISLLPFLGLGNMSSRYSYMSSIGIVFIFVVVLKQLHLFLFSNGKAIAAVSVVFLVGIFCLYQIIQVQQIQRDWSEAGEKSRRFIVAMNGAYENNWDQKTMEFHFVNVPIRSGEAWVFPVGLPDALWLIFQKPNIRIFLWPTLEQAFDAVVRGSQTQKVFQFDESGSVTEMEKPLITQ